METLAERIQMILNELNITQREFASALGLSVNYINLLANGKKQSISKTLAKLVEAKYGYSESWFMYSTGEKLSTRKFSTINLTGTKAELMRIIQQMTDDEAKATLAFVETLWNINKNFPQYNKER